MIISLLLISVFLSLSPSDHIKQLPLHKLLYILKVPFWKLLANNSKCHKLLFLRRKEIIFFLLRKLFPKFTFNYNVSIVSKKTLTKTKFYLNLTVILNTLKQFYSKKYVVVNSEHNFMLKFSFKKPLHVANPSFLFVWTFLTTDVLYKPHGKFCLLI